MGSFDFNNGTIALSSGSEGMVLRNSIAGSIYGGAEREGENELGG